MATDLSNSIPVNWLNCPRKPSLLIANKFIVFKTPLDSNSYHQVPFEHRFTPSMFLECCIMQDVKVGLWINLTKYNYYSKQTIKNKRVNYLQLQCCSHGKPPLESQVTRFIRVCDKFMKANPSHVIAIHSELGFNRAGFMIVAYLARKAGYLVEEALRLFSISRPPGIFDQKFETELFSRYKHGTVVSFIDELPSWYNAHRMTRIKETYQVPVFIDEFGPDPIQVRWLKCSDQSYRLIAGKFSVFKTPLSRGDNMQLLEMYRFSTKTVFDWFKDNHMKLGLWIDLTNSTCCYNKETVQNAGVIYKKIRCVFDITPPSTRQITRFFDVCDSCIYKNEFDKIGVHCIFGYNRAGFMIVSYMVERMNYDLGSALREFAECRPPGIYNEKFLKKLYMKYNNITYTAHIKTIPHFLNE